MTLLVMLSWERKPVKHLSLVDKLLVNRHGEEYRLMEDLKQLGLSLSDLGVTKDNPKTTAPAGFTDHGLVSYAGRDWYMSTYDPPDMTDWGDYEC